MSALPVWLPLLTKATATALIVVIAARAAERVGPFFGGLIASLPLSAGPAYLFVALANDDRFVAASALSSIVTNAATIAFLALLVLLAPRVRLTVAFGTALAVWLGTSVGLSGVAWTAPQALALNAAVFAAAGLAVWRVRPPERVPPARSRWYDTPVRAALVAGLVAVVATLSGLIGPAATGIAAVFPVVLCSVGVIVHRRQGGATAAAAMKGALAANPGFLLGVLTVHALAEPAGRGLALIAALAVMLAWSAGLLVWRWRTS
ncbi:hypothetical protein [Azospirillum halopraeferens]|uniref:hypothetical protein n=1 Tax=Azospirillum halopraeferens TaxID=34010 RepID=UPI0003FE4484|nr:hypothetical protein [Azospirillum halopraeferens]